MHARHIIIFTIFLALFIMAAQIKAAQFEGPNVKLPKELSSDSENEADQAVSTAQSDLNQIQKPNMMLVPQDTIITIGTVTPAIGVIQAWDEKDSLHALTYTLQLQNWSSTQVPWIELSVRPYRSNQPWKIVGDKKRFNPTTGSVSWTLKPFWETPFLGLAEYRFLIDGAETQSFEGPDIIAIVSDAGDSFNGKVHNFEATVNSSENLSVCLVGGDNSLPENIKSWTVKSQCKDYGYGSGEQTFKWTVSETQVPPYYDFDIEIRDAI